MTAATAELTIEEGQTPEIGKFPVAQGFPARPLK
jgi:hypothetical protein